MKKYYTDKGKEFPELLKQLGNNKGQIPVRISQRQEFGRYHNYLLDGILSPVFIPN